MRSRSSFIIRHGKEGSPLRWAVFGLIAAASAADSLSHAVRLVSESPASR